MSDTRPIDIWMLLIELGILVLMILGLLWGVPAWLEKRKDERELQQRLANLASPVADALRALVLQGTIPNNDATTALSQFPPLIERDYTMGWRILPEHKRSIVKWAKKKL